jgi:hypothetical protein
VCEALEAQDSRHPGWYCCRENKVNSSRAKACAECGSARGSCEGSRCARCGRTYEAHTPVGTGGRDPKTCASFVRT